MLLSGCRVLVDFEAVFISWRCNMLMEGYIHVGFLVLWLLSKTVKRSELYKHVLPASIPPTLENVLSRPARKDANILDVALYDPQPELTRTASSTGS